MKRLLLLIITLQVCGLLSLLVVPRLAMPSETHPAVITSITPTPTLASAANPETRITVEPTRAAVGDVITVRARTIAIGIPHYTLTSERGLNIRVTYYNELIDAPEINVNDGTLAFVSAEGGMNEATFRLRALSAGVAALKVYASGEIHVGYPGPAYWGGASSETVEVVIQ